MDSQGGSAEPSMSTADMLRKRHEAEEAHHATVEDVVDEDDLRHSPPSSESPSGNLDNHPDAEDASTAAKTAGRQDDAGTSDKSSAPPKKPAESLDTASYEAFPQLGAVPQSGPSRQATTAWGAKKPQPSVSKTNGTSTVASSGPHSRDQVTPSSAGSSRASTPTSSGIATPVSLYASGNASAGPNSQRTVLPHTMSIPGRHSERISLLPREMKPRNQLKKPVADILRDINRKSKAHEQMMSGHVLKIHPQYHKDLIGTKGSQVHRLQDRYNVRITFPRTTAIRDDQSAADSASETGAAHPTHRSRQGQDEVIVKGPRKGADEARDELLNLLQWVIDNSHTATVSVAQNQIPQLIGQGGREMEKIRMTTGAQVDIPDAKRDASNASGRVDIKLKGSKQQVQEAKQLLEERARTFDDSITRTLEIDRKYHRSLIGSGGATLRDIVTKAGGPEDRRELARMVRFPGPESGNSQIRVEGPRAVVEKIVAAFEGIVHQKEDEMVEVVDVPQAKHRFLIGRGGQTRRDLEAQFNISLDIPKAAENGAAPRNTVRIGGQRDAVAKAKAHILELIRNSDDATVQVPRRLHHVIADNGQFFRKLRNDYDVSVDHAGQQPPARPAAWNPRSGVTYDGAAAAANMPLITDDDESAANAHMWHVRDNNAVAADEADGDGNGEIAWVLRGTPENVGHARDVLLKALDAAQKRPATATGYLILHDPRKHRLVIGPQGSQVNAIRRATGCRINVPRDHGQGEAIEIVGERGKVEEAKNIILDVIARGGNAPGRRRAQ